ncbi:type II secretion system F family protein [bacterium]|nr:type II secretion system F family protein [bacterium]
MSKFFYRVKNINDETETGYIIAQDVSDAVDNLTSKGLTILELSLSDTKTEKKHSHSEAYARCIIFSIKEKSEFINALFFQYKSGLPIQEIFKSISITTASKNLQILSSAVLNQLEQGKSLKEAFCKYQNALGKAYTMLICAGEESGKLDEVLSSLTANIQREEDVKSKIISSLTYPACIFVLAIAIFVFFKSFIFKIFESMFDGICQAQIMKLIFITIFNEIVVLGILAGIIIFLVKNKKAQQRFFSFITKLPVASKLVKNYYFQNFFMVLALSYEAGIPIADAVELAGGTIGINDIRTKIKKSSLMIQKGCEITTAIMVANVFPQRTISQISTGEKAGELDKVLKVISDDYTKKLETSIAVISKLTEPAILILIGCMVAYIVINCYSKYYESLFSMI